jgi:Helix-turn-helix domain
MASSFDTIRRASQIRQRHPDAPPNAVLVALVMATFADGKTGASIRPSFELLAERTGLSISAIQRNVRWLERHDELRRDKQGHRGSAACFTYVGGKPVTSDALSDSIAGQKAGHQRPESQSLVTPHLPNQGTTPSGPSRPSGRAGRRCEVHPAVFVDPGYACTECERENYERKHGRILRSV